MQRKYLSYAALALLLLISAQGCGTAKNSPVENASPLSRYFGPQPLPTGVDAALWADLVRSFDRVLDSSGTARRTNAAPIGAGSDVADLWLYPDGGGGADMRWSYRNEGDLNLDGHVTITDLTPIGVHFQASSTGDNWIEHQIADADGNGVVSVTDLTPIGHNFGGTVAGYLLQSRFFSSTEWTDLSWVPFIASMPGSFHYPKYSFHLVAPLANLVYRVVPTANDSVPYELGVPSNEVLYGLANVPFWNQQMGGEKRSGQSLPVGPQGNTLAWTVKLPGVTSVLQSPVADAYGTTYTTTSQNVPGSMTPGHGTLYAVSRQGELLWSYRSGKSIYGAPVISIDEQVLIQENGGSILSFTRDGKLNWRRDLTETTLGAYYGLGISDSGIITALDPRPVLNGVSLDGTMLWAAPLAASCEAATTSVMGTAMLPLIDGTTSGAGYADGTLMSALPFASNWPLVYDDGNNVLFTNRTSNSIGILPVVFPILASFIPSEGAIFAPPIVVSNDSYVVCANISTGTDTYNCRMYGFDGNGNESWSRTIFAGVFAPMAVDLEGKIFLSGLSNSPDAGVYCVNAGHNIVWHFETPDQAAGPPIPAFTNLLVFHVTDDTPEADSTTLTAVGVVTP